MKKGSMHAGGLSTRQSAAPLCNHSHSVICITSHPCVPFMHSANSTCHAELSLSTAVTAQ
jgi:hypothetical protein